MRNSKKQLIIIFYIILSVINTIATGAQSVQVDTIKLMTYNVGDFGEAPTSQCPLHNFNLKSDYLRTILNYEKPDIIGMTKMNGTQMFCTDSVINYVLDSICDGCWSYGNFSQISTYPKVNMLYFNNTKFGFVGSTVIYSADKNISDITLHELYYKAHNLSETQDTVFLRIVLAHLYPGSVSTDKREAEVAGSMDWLNTHVSGNENLIYMGDYNTTSSDENCFQNLINSSNSNTKFYDPPNQLGQWSNSPADFALYLTQSTRTSDPGDCNPTGGIKNRFDHILVTSAIMNETNSVKYIQGSYKVVGQDGNHTGKALIDSPVNASVPGKIDSALYYMSEHLPVTLKLTISDPVFTSVNSHSKQEIKIEYAFINPNVINIKPITDYGLKNTCNIGKVIIYDMQGRIISSTLINLNQANEVDISNVPNGMYFLKLQIEEEMFVKKFIKP